MPPKPRALRYDAVIVGSGVAGALVAKKLGQAGKNVLILEAGAAAPTNLNLYMNRFYSASAKVPESAYAPELFTKGKLTDPSTLNAGRPTVLTLKAGSWLNPHESYLIQNGPRPFSSTYERVGEARRCTGLERASVFCPTIFRCAKSTRYLWIGRSVMESSNLGIARPKESLVSRPTVRIRRIWASRFHRSTNIRCREFPNLWLTWLSRVPSMA